MGRRNGFNDDDLMVLGEALSARIDSLRSTTETTDVLAPYFRTREKVLAMKGKTAPKLGRPRGSKSRVSAPEVEV